MARTDVDGYGNLYASFAACYEIVLDNLGRDRSRVEVELAHECSPLLDVTEEFLIQAEDRPEGEAILEELKQAFPETTTSVQVRYADPEGEIMRCIDSKVIYPSLRNKDIEDAGYIARTLKMAALFSAYMDKRVPDAARAPKPDWRDRLPRLEDVPPEAAQAGGALLGFALEVFGELWQHRTHRRTTVSQVAWAIRTAEGSE